MCRNGIANDTTIVVYGDKNNWWAAYAYWFFKLNGHEHLKIMDGGRVKWEAEGREYTREEPHYAATNYTPGTYHPELRAFRDDVLAFIDYKNGGTGKNPRGPLVDVRSPQEYSGELMHMPAYPQEGALRGGHIPGAANIPWAKAVAEDGTFKSSEELRAMYEGAGHHAGQGRDRLLPDRRALQPHLVRAARTARLQNVRNYDGSWTEWGNVVGVPIEK